MKGEATEESFTKEKPAKGTGTKESITKAEALKDDFRAVIPKRILRKKSGDVWEHTSHFFFGDKKIRKVQGSARQGALAEKEEETWRDGRF